jgi:hypothetical protein
MPTWPAPPTTVRSADLRRAGMGVVGLAPARFTQMLPSWRQENSLQFRGAVAQRPRH